ncbi:serine/threonine-protein kinase [Mycobacterium noviomagense]|uniref:non-specific serine/threonine protein kinase n=2 Tax=Mycobacteriaceae TaxID=1762 RepID=A0A7I7PA31_9MYCO|nr:serine/threonine-protein kinase [Mycobacterium noviomagense]ORB15914.1 serine/threonine protein kinase [Mycobacterium noviomagense]BBY05429.1 protein kinase [Mycobacterium noviomagense]
MTGSRGGSRVGEMFGPYELRSLIGAGGMGEVYQAYDTVKDRVVAVKLLRREFAADPSYQERFRRESRVAARLQEPHVIPVHDFGEINGVLYIDMRLVEGHDLKTVLAENGPLDPARATSIVAQVAAALDAAHACGLVHRDVKPENVLLNRNDFAYLVDFGIAHLGGETGLTSAGAAIGSCAYMAPERFTGEHVGPPADVYSLACVLYECLTGHTPFPPGDVLQMMAAHTMRRPAPPSVTRPELARDFDDVIARGMEKRPESRFASAGELARAANAAASRQRPAEATHPDQPRDTRRFSQRWPNPEGSDYIPYRDHIQQAEAPPARNRFGRGPLILAVASGIMLLAALVVVFSVIVRDRNGERNGRGPQSPMAPIAPATTESATTTAHLRPSSLPGTDNLGWTSYPGARCDPGTEPAVMARTTQSVLVVCEIQPGNFYYRGVRLSDSASIELANAVRSSQGFDVTNPTDGTRYQIRPTGLTIAPATGQASSEPMLAYAAG